VKADCQDPQDCKFSDWHNWQSMPLVRGYVPFGPCDSVTTGSYLLQDGAAGPWTVWSDCTRRCGGGLKTRTRSIE
ncbi:unnamed protein product, partial [Symbiodinium sp. KB8]